MKNSKKILIVVFIIAVILIGDKIRASASSFTNLLENNLSIDNLIEYINTLDISREEIDEVVDKGKEISDDVKGKESIKDYKITELLRIYKNVTAMAEGLRLDIDFSFKNGDFTLKEKATKDPIFKGNISGIKSYYEAIKNNSDVLSLDVFSNIDNTEVVDYFKNSIEDKLADNENIDNEINDNIKSNIESKVNNNSTILENNKENEYLLMNNDNSNSNILPISIYIGCIITIIISYIKFKR
ncbi:hypothetical protein E5347_04745 [Clostridium sartagoforme]|uniref:Uncharacterized protein n=1 Tax=Clostridium sartagoforme TaxID=84031 RepID=A0A4S2DNZ4_9CLOT|nr:hypothetical protein [Clostridium sartagoforme]TGY44128.1 hypothetical protein E5347_04745 [Clostridium sartagoforme]